MAKSFDIFAASEKIMRMDDETWAHHANPWSVYSRMTAMPLLTFAILSRVWIGWWALAAFAVVILWIWWNPRAFAAPSHTNHWAAHGVFGERVFLNRRSVPIPDHHVAWAYGLTWVSASGVLPWLYGLWAINLWAAALGMVLIVGGKIWFVDRMAWLYQDMKDTNAAYSDWQRV